MTTLRPNNDPQNHRNDPGKRVLMPIINLSEAPTNLNFMAAVGPGDSSAEIIRQHLQRAPHDSLFIFEESPVQLNRPDDIPYLEKEVADLEDLLRNPSDIPLALQKIIANFLQFRREELSTARRKEKDTTDTLPPPTRSPALRPHDGVRKWLRSIFS